MPGWNNDIQKAFFYESAFESQLGFFFAVNYEDLFNFVSIPAG